MTPTDLTIAEAGRAFRDGSLTPLALTEAYLDRIAAHNDLLAAFVTVCGDAAREDARRAGQELSDGIDKGPLHGIPMGIKDIIETRGVRTTGQSALYADRVPEVSATLWSRLEAAGAILLGKTTTWEFAIGGTAYDLPWPPARNPWNADHDTGGSSSGSATAVAAALCCGAIGTDTGGSIRVPAGWCGCAGLKPTYGAVSRAGIYPLSHTLDHAGPICWTAEDCALVMDAIAGSDPRDATACDKAVTGFAAGVRDGVAGLRIGRVRAFSRDLAPSAEVAATLDASFAALEAAGAEVVDIELPPLAEFNATCNLISRAESFSYYQDRIRNHPDKFGAESRARLIAGSMVAAGDYLLAQRARTAQIAALEAAFERVDLILCELSGTTAPEHGGATTYKPLLTRPFNVTGSPVLAVCAGFDAKDMPIAVQVVGPAFADDVVLRAGHVIETSLKTRGKRAIS